MPHHFHLHSLGGEADTVEVSVSRDEVSGFLRLTLSNCKQVVVPGGSRWFPDFFCWEHGDDFWGDAGVFFFNRRIIKGGCFCVIFLFFGVGDVVLISCKNHVCFLGKKREGMVGNQDLSSPRWPPTADGAAVVPLMKPCQEPFLIENKSSEKCPLAKSFGRQHFCWWKWVRGGAV